MSKFECIICLQSIKDGNLFYKCECCNKIYCGNVCFYQDFDHNFVCLCKFDSNGVEVEEYIEEKCCVCQGKVRKCHYKILGENSPFCSIEFTSTCEKAICLCGFPFTNPLDIDYDDYTEKLSDAILLEYVENGKKIMEESK